MPAIKTEQGLPASTAPSGPFAPSFGSAPAAAPVKPSVFGSTPAAAPAKSMFGSSVAKLPQGNTSVPNENRLSLFGSGGRAESAAAPAVAPSNSLFSSKAAKLRPSGPSPFGVASGSRAASAAPLFGGTPTPPPSAVAFGGRASSAAVPLFGTPTHTSSTTTAFGGRWSGGSVQPTEMQFSLFSANQPSEGSLTLFSESSGSQGKPQEQKRVRGLGERFPQAHAMDFGTKFTKVRVGLQPNHTDFPIHEKLLRAPFFVDALAHGSDFTTYIVVGGQKASIFQVYQTWLYTGRLHTKPSGNTSGPGHASHRAEWLSLANAYLLGEYLGDVDFRDTIMDVMVEWFHECPSQERQTVLDTASEIYTKVQSGGPLRRLVSDIAGYYLDDTVIQGMVNQSSLNLPTELFADTLGKLSSRLHSPAFSGVTQPPLVAGRGTCMYHCHGDNECYKKK